MEKILSHTDWNEETIRNLVAGHGRRHASLEFYPASFADSTRDKLMSSLALTVSAMANTYGGIIIIGVKCVKGKAEAFDFIDNSLFQPSAIHAAVFSQVHRKISGFTIQECRFSENMKHSVFILNVPESIQSPHMHGDNRYYKRVKARNLPMEEHEVRLTYMKTNLPDLEFFGLYNTGGIPMLVDGKITMMNFFPKFMIRNISHVIEHAWKFELFIPTTICDSSFAALGDHFSRADGVYSVFSIPNRNPVFQDEIATVVEAKFIVTGDNFKVFEEESIHIKLYYSAGVKTQSLKLLDTFRYQNQPLSYDGFITIDQSGQTRRGE
jgi:hypothetical protein